MRICTLCNKYLELIAFTKKSSYHDSLSPWCKTCKSEKDRLTYERTKETRKKKANDYYSINKDKVLEKRAENRESHIQKCKEWRENNKEKQSKYNKGYKDSHQEEVKTYRKEYNNSNRDKNTISRKKWLGNNPIAKLAVSIRSRTREIIRNKGFSKSKKLKDYLGCTGEEFKTHIESLFEPGMSWENRNLWHLDHSIAISNADTVEKVYELSHYKNIKPMWAEKNLSKNKNSSICWQKLQRDKLLDEDLKNGMPVNTKASEFILTEESLTDEHRKFIERYEWLGTIGFGVRKVFVARYNGILGGLIMIAEPNGYQFGVKLEALIQRGACASWTPKNLGSRLVMFACNWMVQNTTKRIFTAYSDPEAGEIGTIYQACNFDYLGKTFGVNIEYSYNGKWVNGRYFTRTASMKKWAKKLNIRWMPEWLKENGFQDIKNIPKEVMEQLKSYAKKEMMSCTKRRKAHKGKYVLLLKKHRKEQINKTWEALPYPKRAKL